MKNHINRIFFLFLFFCTTQVFAQFSLVPYYGKNKVQYGKFHWNIYKTEHFKVFHYIDNSQILKNIAEMAESAYQKISLEIKHALSKEVPIIYYKTYTDFEQTNLLPAQEGILGVSEPVLYRVIIYGDLTLDQIQALIEHELSHIFEFDILFGNPGGGVYAINAPPGWVMEGWPEYNTAIWDPWSLLIVRDAALNDRIPELTGSGNLLARYPLPRVPDYDFGHAMFDFIEAKFGKDGIREFWQSMKNSSLIRTRNPIRSALKMTNKQFNHEFKKYLRERFKDYLPKENPEDYSISLGPEFPLNPYYFALSHSVSPSGDILAVLTLNYNAFDVDILLISTKDGSVIKNITSGYTINYEYIRYSARPARGPDLAWSNDGDTVAFFGRSGEKYALILVNPLTGNTEKKIHIPYDQPTSPCFYPDDKELLFTAFDNGIQDIFKLNLDTKEFLNLTKDDLFEKAPSLSPDGKKLAYTIRLNEYDKLFLSPIDNLNNKTQLTFGSGNTISPHFSPDSKEIYFSGDIRGAYNIYSLNLETGEQKRFTDVQTGNFFPIPLPNDPKKLIFSAFNKGALQIFKSEFEGEVEKTVAFGEEATAEKLERFEPFVSLEINRAKISPHKGIGKLYLDQRPPIDAFVASDGSIFGGGSINLSDILADYTLSFTAFQYRSFRSYQIAFINQKRRLQYMASAFQYTLFYYSPSFYDPTLPNYLLNPRNALATRKITGAQFSAYYPFSRFYRAQASVGYLNYDEKYYAEDRGQSSGFWNGPLVSADIALVGETTRFKYPFGPVAGNTFRISFSQSIPVADNFLQNTTLRADLRQYLYLGSDFLLAFRFNGFISRGRNPYISYWGGNNEVRSMDFYSIIGNEGWYANAEFRLPLVSSMSSILGQLGPIRGVFFFDLSRSKFGDFPTKIWVIETNPGPFEPAFALYDAVGSWGYGFEFFFLGIPFHLEFAKMITIDDFSDPFNISTRGRFRTNFWIGFDF